MPTVPLNYQKFSKMDQSTQRFFVGRFFDSVLYFYCETAIQNYQFTDRKTRISPSFC